MLKLKKVLFACAHPDDNESGACGLMLKLIKNGIDVRCVVFSNCEGQPGNNGISQEWEAVVREIGIKKFKLYDFPETKLPKYSDEIRELLEGIKEEKISLIVTHSLGSIMQDHKTVAEECNRVFRNNSMICYEHIKSEPNFRPNFFVELTNEETEKKIDLLMRFKTQHRKYYHKPDLFRSILRFRGAQAGVEYAEAFEIVRLIL